MASQMDEVPFCENTFPFFLVEWMTALLSCMSKHVQTTRILFEVQGAMAE